TVFLDTNGNGQLDPGESSVVTDSTGHYSFTGLTPGTYTVAIVPPANFSRTLPASSATYSVTITTDGQAIAGDEFGVVLLLPDLATSSVSFNPSTSGPGDPVIFAWTATNRGEGPAAGSWQDAVYLSSTPTLGPDAILIGTAAHTGGLAANASYSGSLTVHLPVL